MVFPLDAGARSPVHHDPPLAHMVLQRRHGCQPRFGLRLGRERRRGQVVLQHHRVAAGASTATRHTRNGQLTSRCFRSFLRAPSGSSNITLEMYSMDTNLQGLSGLRAVRLSYFPKAILPTIACALAAAAAAHPRWLAVNPNNLQRQQITSPSFPP